LLGVVAALQQRPDLSDQLGEADGGDAVEGLEERGRRMRGERCDDRSLDLDDLDVEDADLCNGGSDDRSEDNWRDPDLRSWGRLEACC
jgi:hypothetical protein